MFADVQESIVVKSQDGGVVIAEALCRTSPTDRIERTDFVADDRLGSCMWFLRGGLSYAHRASPICGSSVASSGYEFPTPDTH